MAQRLRALVALAEDPSLVPNATWELTTLPEPISRGSKALFRTFQALHEHAAHVY